MIEDKANNADEDQNLISTYGIITAQRLLTKYSIELDSHLLNALSKNRQSFYHILASFPLKNVLNGIILQQAHDYLVYVQKLYVDYVISGESSKPESSPGGVSRMELENIRQELVTEGENFNALEMDHKKLISQGQKSLIAFGKQWDDGLKRFIKQIKSTFKLKDSFNDILYLVHHAICLAKADSSQQMIINVSKKLVELFELSEQDLTDVESSFKALADIADKTINALNPLMYDTNQNTESARLYRAYFRKTILEVFNIMQLLPEYSIDYVQIEKNKENLYFDSELGDALKPLEDAESP